MDPLQGGGGAADGSGAGGAPQVPERDRPPRAGRRGAQQAQGGHQRAQVSENYIFLNSMNSKVEITRKYMHCKQKT